MPLVDIASIRPLDLAIMKATGIELVPVDESENLILTLNGKDYYAIPIHES